MIDVENNTMDVITSFIMFKLAVPVVLHEIYIFTVTDMEHFFAAIYYQRDNMYSKMMDDER